MDDWKGPWYIANYNKQPCECHEIVNKVKGWGQLYNSLPVCKASTGCKEEMGWTVKRKSISPNKVDCKCKPTPDGEHGFFRTAEECEMKTECPIDWPYADNGPYYYIQPRGGGGGGDIGYMCTGVEKIRKDQEDSVYTNLNQCLKSAYRSYRKPTIINPSQSGKCGVCSPEDCEKNRENIKWEPKRPNTFGCKEGSYDIGKPVFGNPSGAAGRCGSNGCCNLRTCD
jgi:hypothetical protein